MRVYVHRLSLVRLGFWLSLVKIGTLIQSFLGAPNCFKLLEFSAPRNASTPFDASLKLSILRNSNPAIFVKNSNLTSLFYWSGECRRWRYFRFSQEINASRHLYVSLSHQSIYLSKVLSMKNWRDFLWDLIRSISTAYLISLIPKSKDDYLSGKGTAKYQHSFPCNTWLSHSNIVTSVIGLHPNQLLTFSKLLCSTTQYLSLYSWGSKSIVNFWTCLGNAPTTMHQ